MPLKKKKKPQLNRHRCDTNISIVNKDFFSFIKKMYNIINCDLFYILYVFRSYPYINTYICIYTLNIFLIY